MCEERLEEDLYVWVNDMDLSKPKRNFARDFSDGVAEILKKEYPRLVELHNYAPANSLTNKMKNWTRLNQKVLRKIDLAQNDAFLKDVASSKRVAVEKLLSTIKKKLDDVKEEKRNRDYSVEEEITEEGIMVVDIRLKSTVPYDDFKLLQQELAKKEEELHSLQSKVSHLEALISLKNQRLSDLTEQMKRCVCYNS